MYRVERAKSSRSRCNAQGSARMCDGSIAKDALRVGWMNSETGTYGGWVNLSCWRVPNRVWLGLPSPETSSEAAITEAPRSMAAALINESLRTTTC